MQLLLALALSLFASTVFGTGGNTPRTQDPRLNIVDDGDGIIDTNTPEEQPTRRQSPVRTPKLGRMLPYFDDGDPSSESIAHWVDSALGEGSTIMAGLRITTNVPSVNLDNVPGMQSIICSDDTVILTLASLYSARRWTVEPTVLIIGSHHNCGKQNKAEFTMRLTKSWIINKRTKTLIFETVDPESNGVVGDFEIVAHPSVTLDDPNTKPVSKIYTRSLDNDMISSSPYTSNSTSMPYNFFDQSSPKPERDDLIFRKNKHGHMLNKRGIPIDHTMSIPLGINLMINKSITIPIPMTTGSIGMGCKPCGIKGSSSAKFRVWGQLFQAPKFSVTWEGHLKAFAVFNFDLKLAAITDPTEVPIFEIPLTPIYMPGIFQLGPSFEVNLRTEIAFIGEMSVRTNMSAELPGFKAFSSTEEQKQLTGFTPVYHINSATSANLEGRLQLGIIPALALKASVFTYDLIQTSISVDLETDIKLSAFGMVATDESNNTKKASAKGGKFCIGIAMGIRLLGKVLGSTRELLVVPMTILLDKCWNSIKTTENQTGVTSVVRQKYNQIMGIKPPEAKPAPTIEPVPTEPAVLWLPAPVTDITAPPVE
ncbi:hypothetical protein BDV3_005567 [Batrachochytrium dendrobatidis]